MTNSEVVHGWVNAMPKFDGYSPKHLATANLRADGKYLVSYATPIAKYEDGKFKLTSKRFSVTTARHKSLVKRFVPEGKLEIVEEIACPDGAYPWKWSGL